MCRAFLVLNFFIATLAIPLVDDIYRANVEITMHAMSFQETVAVTEFRNNKLNVTHMILHTSNDSVAYFFSPSGAFVKRSNSCEEQHVDLFSHDQLFEMLHVMKAIPTHSSSFLHSAKYANTSVLRGIPTEKWSLELRMTRTNLEMDLTFFWHFSREWNMNGAALPQLLGIYVEGRSNLLNGTIVPWDLQVTVLGLSQNTVDLGYFSIPQGCVATSPTIPPNATVKPLEPLQPAISMPSLPTDFSATIESTLVETRESFTVFEAFSTTRQMSKTTVVKPDADLIGRHDIKSVFVVGTFQLAYEFTDKSLPIGVQSVVSSGIREMFFPDRFSCSKTIFRMDLLGSVENLLLRSSTPRYMGSTVVRGITARMWQTQTSLYSVQWFFAEPNWRIANNVSEPLLRIVITGKGRSPLFVHHPFFQKGEEVTPEAESACNSFFSGIVGQCNEEPSAYKHVHEFVSFVPFIPSDTFAVPDACIRESSVAAIPSAPRCPVAMSAFGLFLLVAWVAIFSFAVGVISTFVCMRHKMKEIPS